MTNLNITAKYRLLVLMDLSKASYTALKNAVNLAKLINGSIEVFHVKPPAHAVKNDNQISAIRSIDEERHTTKRKLRNLVNTVSQEENVPIIYDFTFGNVKNEIKQHLEQTNPDVVVLGKKKQKLVNLLGDGLTQFLLNEHKGVILIAGKDEKLRSDKDISLGFYGDTLKDINVELTRDICKQSKGPSKFFNVRKAASNTMAKDAIADIKSIYNIKNSLEYEFEEGSNSMDGLASYVSKHNVDLLFIGREKKKKAWTGQLINGLDEASQVIQKVNVPVLIMN